MKKVKNTTRDFLNGTIDVLQKKYSTLFDFTAIAACYDVYHLSALRSFKIGDARNNPNIMISFSHLPVVTS